MTHDESNQLKVGSSVMWDNDPEDAGVIKEIKGNAVYIAWDNGQGGWLDRRDLKPVSMLTEDWED